MTAVPHVRLPCSTLASVRGDSAGIATREGELHLLVVSERTARCLPRSDPARPRFTLTADHDAFTAATVVVGNGADRLALACGKEIVAVDANGLVEAEATPCGERVRALASACFRGSSRIVVACEGAHLHVLDASVRLLLTVAVPRPALDLSATECFGGLWLAACLEGQADVPLWEYGDALAHGNAAPTAVVLGTCAPTSAVRLRESNAGLWLAAGTKDARLLISHATKPPRRGSTITPRIVRHVAAIEALDMVAVGSGAEVVFADSRGGVFSVGACGGRIQTLTRLPARPADLETYGEGGDWLVVVGRIDGGVVVSDRASRVQQAVPSEPGGMIALRTLEVEAEARTAAR